MDENKEILRFTIPIRPRTKKTGEHIEWKNGHPRIVQSEAYKEYLRECRKYIPRLNKAIDVPINVKTVFYMPTRKRIDLSNLIACIHDVLTFYKVIEDDQMKIVRSVDGSGVFYDKENPRTEVTITTVRDDREMWEPVRRQ